MWYLLIIYFVIIYGSTMYTSDFDDELQICIDTVCPILGIFIAAILGLAGF